MGGNIVRYAATEHKKTVGEKEVTIRRLKPVFTDDEERQRRKRHIQDGLYHVFSKYMRSS